VEVNIHKKWSDSYHIATGIELANMMAHAKSQVPVSRTKYSSRSLSGDQENG